MSVTLPVGISDLSISLCAQTALIKSMKHAAENNNDRSTLANVFLTPPPDLEVSAVTGAANATAGRSYSVTFTVENFGATGTPNSSWIDSVFLSGIPRWMPATSKLPMLRARVPWQMAQLMIAR